MRDSLVAVRLTVLNSVCIRSAVTGSAEQAGCIQQN